MLPHEYQIDQFTARRMEREMGAPLPDGALEALYEFEAESAAFTEVLLRNYGPGPEFTWCRAMLLAKLGPIGYLEQWVETMSSDMRTLIKQLNAIPEQDFE